MGRERPEGVDMNIRQNPLKRLERDVSRSIGQLTGQEVQITFVEAPPQTGMDYGIQIASLIKNPEEKPADLAKILAQKIQTNIEGVFERVEAQGPYLNFRLDMGRLGGETVDTVLTQKGGFGKENIGKGSIIAIDMSSPNIAKRMSYGHLRSTIIGDAIANLYRAKGYEVIRDNHIGDWGTQFGKLIVAIKRWGNEREILASDDPIGALQDLYVKFHEEAEAQAKGIREELKVRIGKEGAKFDPGFNSLLEKQVKQIMHRKGISIDKVEMDKAIEDTLDKFIDPPLEKEGREWFAKLEKGDSEARRIWKLCVDMSMKEFQEMYDVLGVNFELTLGESFYEGMLGRVMEEVGKSKAGKVSEGALVVDMRDTKLDVAIIRKSDGASVYMTRDLACAIYREEKLGAKGTVYVVGEDQKYYFQQLFEVLKRLDHKIGEKCVHVYFGTVSLPEGKMSTRKGRTILLKDVVEEGLDRAEDILRTQRPETNRDEELREKVARQIAIGALKWNDLSQDPKRKIVFDWDKALNFDGYAAPYVQYAAVRARSILLRQGPESLGRAEKRTASEIYSKEEERALVRHIASYPGVLTSALRSHNPSKVAIFAFELAKRFSAFYDKVPVARAESSELKHSRLRLVASIHQVLSNALGILGIEIPEKM